MIIVLATVKVLPEYKSQAFALSQTHVARSRTEPGCVAHAVFEDPEQPDHLHFVEEWSSEEMLTQHISVPASSDFVNALITMAVGRPRFRIFRASEMPFPRMGTATGSA